MSLIDRLMGIPIGRWGSITIEDGRIDVYRCDAEDNDAYIIEMRGNPRVRLSMRKAIQYLKGLGADE